MNVTELARKLRITPKKLKEVMPELGFDIGARAIKVDAKMASAILEKLSDSKIRKQYLENEVIEKPRKDIITEAVEGEQSDEVKIVNVPERIVVKELAKRMDLPVTNLVLELMKNGVMASLNQDIDFETASIIAEDLGFEVKKSEEDGSVAKNIDYDEVLKVDKKSAKARPPVVVVMGHVDHGKTKLLDAIRSTHIVDAEAGGITQHIGAYQVEKDGRLLTFIDTPGHEAFSAMRSRGAQVADIAILLVAADDGVQPQTIEAVSHIRNAGLPFIVAINKIDKPDANIDKVKSDLAQIDLNPEDWGGKTICVEVSAKKNLNIDGLLETLFLVADMEKENIVANNGRSAVGTIIESHVDKGEGPVATVLIQNGTLKRGDLVKIGPVSGKIRAMKNWKGEIVNETPPSMPVKILGLNNIPQVGEILTVVDNKKDFRKMSKIRKGHKVDFGGEAIGIKNEDEEEVKKPQVNLFLKADVLGSIEAIIESLQKINQDKVDVKVVKQSLGNITEADIENAIGLSAHLIGFNVKITTEAKRLATTKDFKVELYEVIYDLLQFVEDKIKELAGTEKIETEIGRLKVLKIFRTGKNWQIVGGNVKTGIVKSDLIARIYRDGVVLEEAKVVAIEAGKESVAEVAEGQECGMKIEGTEDIREGDEVAVISIEEK
jgi:translation initiation factor IF-2